MHDLVSTKMGSRSSGARSLGLSPHTAHSCITNDTECKKSCIAVVIPVTMIHIVLAAGNCPSNMVLRDVVNPRTYNAHAIPRQSHPEAETAGTLTAGDFSGVIFMELFSEFAGSEPPGFRRKRTSSIMNLDWCFPLVFSLSLTQRDSF